MENFLFFLKHRSEVKTLMTRLGLSKEDAKQFLYENYNKGVTFKEYFKKYLQMWLPDGETSDGRMKMVYTFKFPKRSVNLNFIAGNNDFNWRFFAGL